MFDHPALKWGLIYGIFFIILNTIFQYTAPRMIFTGIPTTILSFGMPIFCMVMAGVEIKKMQEGYLSFGEGIKHTFLVWAIGSLLMILHGYIQMHFIDPSLLEVQKEVVLETGQMVGEFFGMPEEMQDELNDEMAAAAEDMEHQTFGSAIFSWMSGCILGVIISMIISAIIKKN